MQCWRFFQPPIRKSGLTIVEKKQIYHLSLFKLILRNNPVAENLKKSFGSFRFFEKKTYTSFKIHKKCVHA
jgi:hypothetical protein